MLYKPGESFWRGEGYCQQISFFKSFTHLLRLLGTMKPPGGVQRAGKEEKERRRRCSGTEGIGVIYGGGMHMGPMCGDRGLVACQAVFVLSLFFFLSLVCASKFTFFFFVAFFRPGRGLGRAALAHSWEIKEGRSFPRKTLTIRESRGIKSERERARTWEKRAKETDRGTDQSQVVK